MNKLNKLARKVVLLSVLTTLSGVLAFTDLGVSTTRAIPCCSSCAEIEADCETMPPGPGRNGCLRIATKCYNVCNWSC